MNRATLGSLFDGSGGFPLAGILCGITPAWAAEVEPYPIAVTRSRFPNMKHLGDISKVRGAEIQPVAVITFGSPCQDLSVAGKRAGLKHEANGDEETTRSGLFMEAVRIIKEMRRATNGLYPAFALWENVPGAFSSNKGEDFRIVLEELIKIVEPGAVMPEVPKNGWAYADSYCGDGWSLAYRVFDAQYWGVPQRRRRIHLVLDLRGERAREVLFEREGVRGYFAQSGAPWQGVASDAENRAGAADCEGVNDVIPINTMIATRHKQLGRGTGFGVGEIGDAQFTISAGHEHAVCYSIENHPADSRVNIDDSGKGWKEDTCYTLNTIDRPAVAFVEKKTECLDVGFFSSYEETSPTLLARMYKDPHLVTYPESAVRYIVRRLTPTECARLQGFADKWGHPDRKENFTEEEYRFWLDVRNTHATVIGGKEAKEYTKEQMLKWYNGLHTDSAEYKMWGNGIALPPALYVMQGIRGELKNSEDG